MNRPSVQGKSSSDMQAGIRKTSDADIAGDLRRMAQNINDIDSLLDQIGDFIFSIIQESFAEGKQPSGAKWEALAASTIRLKIRSGFPAQPLVRTGRLKNGVMVQLEDKQVSISFSLELQRIAQYHQQGTKNAPARPLITALSPEDSLELTRLITAHIERGVIGLSKTETAP
jgi:phage gpG-like protein